MPPATTADAPPVPCVDRWGAACRELAGQGFCDRSILTLVPETKGEEAMLAQATKKYKWVSDVCCHTCWSGDVCTAFPALCSSKPSHLSHGIVINKESNDAKDDYHHLPLKGVVPTQLGNVDNFVLLFTDPHVDRFSGTLPTQIGRFSNASLHLHLDSLDPLAPLSDQGNRISGTLPTELGRLCQASHVDFHLHLTGSAVSGTIPTQIGRIKSESCHLHLGSTHISGTLPSELYQLTQLRRFLILNDGSISGTLPTQFANLANLSKIHLHGNRFSGSLPTELGTMTGVVDFRVARNRFSGTLPSELATIRTHAVHIDLTDNLLSGSLPYHFTTLSALKSDAGHWFAGMIDDQEGACLLGVGDGEHTPMIECTNILWPTACAGACWKHAKSWPQIVLLLWCMIDASYNACKAVRRKMKKNATLI